MDPIEDIKRYCEVQYVINWNLKWFCKGKYVQNSQMLNSKPHYILNLVEEYRSVEIIHY